jgi:hypothetical protein
MWQILFATSYLAINFSGFFGCPLRACVSSRANAPEIQGSRRLRVAECKSDEAIFPSCGPRDGSFWGSPRSRESRFFDVRARRAFEARAACATTILRCLCRDRKTTSSCGARRSRGTTFDSLQAWKPAGSGAHAPVPGGEEDRRAMGFREDMPCRAEGRPRRTGMRGVTVAERR